MQVWPAGRALTMKQESITFKDVSQTLQPTIDRALTTQTEPLPVGVIGCGRMGKLHARVYSQMAQVRLVGVYDADEEVAKATVAEFGGEVFQSPEALADRQMPLTLAGPTNALVPLPQPFLRRGVATLTETPPANDA